MIGKRGEMGQPVKNGTWYKKCTLVKMPHMMIPTFLDTPIK